MTPPIAAAAETPVLRRVAPSEARSHSRSANVRVPRHIATVVDCVTPMAALIDGALNAGVEFLSIQIAGDGQAFSDFLISEGSTWVERGVRVQKLCNTVANAGEIAALHAIDRLVENSQPNAAMPRMTVTFAVAYDTKKDIAQAAAACRQCVEGEITPSQLLQNMVSRDLPPVDLFLQSGDSRKLSAFLLWHAAYAELGFMRASWTEFSGEALRGALQDYASRTRTFGAVPAK